MLSPTDQDLLHLQIIFLYQSLLDNLRTFLQNTVNHSALRLHFVNDWNLFDQKVCSTLRMKSAHSQTAIVFYIGFAIDKKRMIFIMLYNAYLSDKRVQ